MDPHLRYQQQIEKVYTRDNLENSISREKGSRFSVKIVRKINDSTSKFIDKMKVSRIEKFIVKFILKGNSEFLKYEEKKITNRIKKLQETLNQLVEYDLYQENLQNKLKEPIDTSKVEQILKPYNEDKYKTRQNMEFEISNELSEIDSYNYDNIHYESGQFENIA